MITNQQKIKNLGYNIMPMEFKTIWCNGFESVADTWITYRDEYVTRNPDGTVDNIKNGKHYTKEAYDKEIFDMDISVSYMEMINLEITSSTAFREFILGMGLTKSCWGLSSRDHAEFMTNCSEEFAMYNGTVKAYEEFKKIHDAYKAGLDSFDALRECLPIAYQTKFRIFLPVKQFIIAIATFYEAFHNVLPETWKCIYTAMYENEDLRPWLFKINQYRNTEESRMFIGKDKKDWSGGSFTCSNMNYKYIGNIGSVLYSQLIRMENSRTYGYSEFLMRIPEMENANCKVPFPCWTAMSDDRVNEIMKTRTSWFASNTWDGDPNAWNAFMKSVWIEKLDKNEKGDYIPTGEVSIDDNWKFFKFLMESPTGDIIVNQVALDRYLADDEGRFHENYNRFWISPYILEDGRVIIDRINQQGYSKLMDLWCQIYKRGILKENPNNPNQKKWYEEWIDKNHSSNTDYRKWTKVWNYYLNNNISVKDLMKKFKLHSW